MHKRKEGFQSSYINFEMLQLHFPNRDLTPLEPTDHGEVKIIYPLQRLDFSGHDSDNFGGKNYRGKHRSHTRRLYAVRFTGLQRRRKRNK